MLGKIISFEGIEGTGKSTQIQYLKNFLSSKNIPSCTIREPGNTYIGEQIRNLLQYDKKANNMFAETELLLYEASRAQLIREFILPTIQDGIWVICDRFFDSSTSYQGAARKLPIELVQQLNRFAVASCVPNLTILLDIDITTAFQRMNKRSDDKDRIESEPRKFFEIVRQKYLEIAAEEPGRFFIVDATYPMESIAETICAHVQKHFSL